MSNQSIKAPLELRTPRLILRAPDPDFSEDCIAAIRETFKELKRWMPWAQQIPSLPEMQKYFLETRTRFLASEAFDYFTFLQSNNQFAGACGFPRIDWNKGTFEIGYWIRKSLMHHGYVTEAVRALAAFAFESLQATRVEIHMSDLNEPSWRVAESSGFYLERIIPADSTHPDGSLRDTRIYALEARRS